MKTGRERLEEAAKRVIAEYNTSHDARGRFSSRARAAQVVPPGKLDQKQGSRRVKRAEARYNTAATPQAKESAARGVFRVMTGVATALVVGVGTGVAIVARLGHAAAPLAEILGPGLGITAGAVVGKVLQRRAERKQRAEAEEAQATTQVSRKQLPLLVKNLRKAYTDAPTSQQKDRVVRVALLLGKELVPQLPMG